MSYQRHPDHVYWIGGPPDAGKSTVAAVIAKKVNGIHYRQDEHEMRHIREADPDRHPHHAALRHQLATQDEAEFVEEAWVRRSVQDMVETSRANWTERIDLICADLALLPTDRPIIAEGPGLFPDVILPLVQSRSQAIWLIPTDTFKQQSHQRRGKSGFAPLTSNPDLARRNHIERDLLFAQSYRTEVSELRLPWIEIDGNRTADEIAEEVLQHFGLASMCPPGAVQ